jgi:hypothetical protein
VINQVLYTDLRAAFPDGWPAEYDPSADVGAISSWPPEYTDPVVAAYVRALSTGFWICTGLAVLAFGFSLFLKHIPLRKTLDNPIAKAQAEKAAAEKAAKENGTAEEVVDEAPLSEAKGLDVGSSKGVAAEAKS